MIRGFTMIELLVGLTLMLTVFSLVITNMGQSVKTARDLTRRQNLLEAVFFTVDRLKEDLVKCGMRFQELRRVWDIPVISHTPSSVAITYGKAGTFLSQPAQKGEDWLMAENLHCFAKNKQIVIYDPAFQAHEFAKIRRIRNGLIHLQEKLVHGYPENAVVILIRRIEYKYYQKQGILKRKVDRGYFQPLVEEVTDFQVSVSPRNPALLYRLEINRREQVQGYIFLNNMVLK